MGAVWPSAARFRQMGAPTGSARQEPGESMAEGSNAPSATVGPAEGNGPGIHEDNQHEKNTRLLPRPARRDGQPQVLSARSSALPTCATDGRLIATAAGMCLESPLPATHPWPKNWTEIAWL